MTRFWISTLVSLMFLFALGCGDEGEVLTPVDDLLTPSSLLESDARFIGTAPPPPGFVRPPLNHCNFDPGGPGGSLRLFDSNGGFLGQALLQKFGDSFLTCGSFFAPRPQKFKGTAFRLQLCDSFGNCGPAGFNFKGSDSASGFTIQFQGVYKQRRGGIEVYRGNLTVGNYFGQNFGFQGVRCELVAP